MNTNENNLKLCKGWDKSVRETATEAQRIQILLHGMDELNRNVGGLDEVGTLDTSYNDIISIRYDEENKFIYFVGILDGGDIVLNMLHMDSVFDLADWADTVESNTIYWSEEKDIQELVSEVKGYAQL